MEETDAQIMNALSKVSSTISALESAIATWDGMANKPKEHEQTIASMRRLHSKLEAWERKALKDLKASTEAKRKDISELISISDSSKGDFRWPRNK